MGHAREAKIKFCHVLAALRVRFTAMSRSATSFAAKKTGTLLGEYYSDAKLLRYLT